MGRQGFVSQGTRGVLGVFEGLVLKPSLVLPALRKLRVWVGWATRLMGGVMSAEKTAQNQF